MNDLISPLPPLWGTPSYALVAEDQTEEANKRRSTADRIAKLETRVRSTVLTLCWLSALNTACLVVIVAVSVIQPLPPFKVFVVATLFGANVALWVLIALRYVHDLGELMRQRNLRDR